MPRPSPKLDAALALAAQPDGTSTQELRRVLACSNGAVQTLLKRMQDGCSVVRCKGPGKSGMRYFRSSEQMGRWMRHQLALLTAHAVALRRIEARGEARDAVMSRQPAALRAHKRTSAQAVPAGVVPWAEQEAVITDKTKITVYQRKPDPHHIDIMADALPGVPGWRGGPQIRDGALEFKRHQANPVQSGGFAP